MGEWIGIIAVFATIIFGIVLMLLGKKYSKEYEDEIELLNEKFKFKEDRYFSDKDTDVFTKLKKLGDCIKNKLSGYSMAVGIAPLILKMFDKFNYDNSSFLERKMERKFRSIYEGKNSKEYLRVYIAKAVANSFIVLLGLSLVFSVWINDQLKESVVVQGNSIIKPEGGTLEVPLSFELDKNGEKKKRDLILKVPAKVKTEEEMISLLNDSLDESDILMDNESLDKITSKLRLRKSFKGFNSDKYLILWESDVMDLVDVNGNIKRPTQDEEDKNVNLTMKVIRKEDNELIWDKNFSMNIMKMDVPTEAEILNNVNTQLEDYLNGDEKTIDIPEEIEGINVKWKVKNKTALYIVMMMALIILSGVLGVVDFENNTMVKLKEKNNHILFELPEFLNKLLLLINAGENMQKAWMRVAEDTDKDNYFYRIVKEIAYDMKHTGTSELDAYEKFKHKCSVQEVNKFVNIIRQNLRKGSSEMAMRLEELSKDCWKRRVDVTKERGKQASSKLLLPMIIMLIAIITIVGMPAIMQISG